MHADDPYAAPEPPAPETLVVSTTADGFRVYPPTVGGASQHVRETEDGLTCTCEAFRREAPRDEHYACAHVLAVQGRLGNAPSPSPQRMAESPVQESEDTAQMLLKRSVSPDGRIDALSVEFACPVPPTTAEAVQQRAAGILKLQSAIVAEFLGQPPRTGTAPAPREPHTARPQRAQLLNIAGDDGRWGRRLYIRVQVGDRILRLYGSRTQLTEQIVAAGFPELAHDIGEGTQLNLPCLVTLKPSTNGRFLNVTSVRPADPFDPQGSARTRT